MAASVAVVGQEPARGHVGGAGVGRVADDVGGGLVAQPVVIALVVGVGGVETVGVAELEAPHRRHERLSADVGVRVQHGLERVAGEVPGVEALLVVGEGGGGVEAVGAGGPGVAHDAVAVGGHVEGGGAGVVVLAPLVVHGDRDGPAAQRPFAQAQAGPVELLVRAPGQVLGGPAAGPAGGLGLLPDGGGVVGAVDGEPEGRFVDPDGKGSGADPVVRAGVGGGRGHGSEVGGDGEVGAGRVVGEGPVGREPETEDVGAGDDHAGLGPAGGRDGEGVAGPGEAGEVARGGRGPGGRFGRGRGGERGERSGGSQARDGERGGEQGGGRPAPAPLRCVRSAA